MSRTVLGLALALALGACGKAATESDNPRADASPVPMPAVAGGAPAAFAQCLVCHKVEPGTHGIGPSLAGVAGRPAAGAPGYAYSSALKNAGLTWDDAALDRFTASPMSTVPGTKMVYAGLKDPAKRAEVVAYLKTI